MDYKNLLKLNEDGSINLYHGSRGGIEGSIEPASRSRCDFGRGFYMGTLPMQAKSLVAGDDAPYFYQLKFDISKINPEKILVLSDKDWLYTILSNRKTSDDFNELLISKIILDEIKKYDVIIGNIADDKMRAAMNSFIEDALTDEGLKYCLNSTNDKLGIQVVAKTQEACNLIKIVKEVPLKGLELENAIHYGDETLKSCDNIVKFAKRNYTDEGMRLSAMIKMERFGASLLTKESRFMPEYSKARSKLSSQNFITRHK